MRDKNSGTQMELKEHRGEYLYKYALGKEFLNGSQKHYTL